MTDTGRAAHTAQYLLAGNRSGWDFSGLTRRDLPDGYTEFIGPGGSVKAVVVTWLLVNTQPEVADD